MKATGFLLAVALAPTAALAADFTGQWHIQSSVNGNPVTIGCTLVQNGDALTGNCRPEVDGIEPSALTGTVDGTTAKWGYEVVFNGNTNRVAYDAQLGADGTLTGTLMLGTMPTTFTASKR